VTTEEPTLGAIDVGSNTIHLVVARPTANGIDLRYLDDQVELVRLGADVGALGRIGQERMARAVETVRRQAGRARELGARAILGLATEGVRSAANGTELIDRVRDEAGVELALVTGEQEAALTYWGATSGLGGRAERQAVMDLGGGSLELVEGEGTAVQWRVSLPLGSGTVHDRYAASDPPTDDELAMVGRVVEEELAQLEPPPVRRATACGGTATTLVMLASVALGGGEEKGAMRILDETRMAALLDLVQQEPASELSRRYGVDLARARLLGAGCVVLREAMRRVGADRLEVSRRGIREGAILAYVHMGEGWLEAARLGAGW
jgi:exopolyphosphatase/guanosine-5'-triphosphate,3'-diphosphate pyrophosphatase